MTFDRVSVAVSGEAVHETDWTKAVVDLFKLLDARLTQSSQTEIFQLSSHKVQLI